MQKLIRVTIMATSYLSIENWEKKIQLDPIIGILLSVGCCKYCHYIIEEKYFAFLWFVVYLFHDNNLKILLWRWAQVGPVRAILF